MKRIKGSNTKPEIRLRKALWTAGLRYRLNVKSLPGSPDIANKKLKVAIFIDGEFWHGFQWKDKKPRIKSNRDYWLRKIEKNIIRDEMNNSKLSEIGFKVFRFWEHEVNRELDRCVSEITQYLSRNSMN